MPTKTCPNCGVEFGDSMKPSRLAKQTHCSDKCAKKSRELRVEANCAECSAVVLVRPYRLKKYPRLFCSKACKNKTHAREVSGTNNPAYRGGEGLQSYDCTWCGKEVKTYPSRVRAAKFCSLDCKAAYASKYMNGINSPSYRGGKVKYHGRNWKRQSHLALRRDGYRCQICLKQLGRKGYDYGVHHIKPYREFNGDYENANRLLNLVTLCRRCHALVECGKLPCPQPLL